MATSREVFLYFQDGDNDAYCYPLSSFIGFVHDANLTLNRSRFSNVSYCRKQRKRRNQRHC